MASLGYLGPGELTVYAPIGSEYPRVEIHGKQCILGAQFRRLFPLSKPQEFICVQDAAGKEVCILKGTSGLDQESANVLSSQLDRRYFTPVIDQIVDLRQEAGMWRFTVTTQRGDAEFFVRNWRDSAHELTAGRWQIQSVDGGRFDIPNMEALDARSRKLMARLL